MNAVILGIVVLGRRREFAVHQETFVALLASFLNEEGRRDLGEGDSGRDGFGEEGEGKSRSSRGNSGKGRSRTPGDVATSLEDAEAGRAVPILIPSFIGFFPPIPDTIAYPPTKITIKRRQIGRASCRERV